MADANSPGSYASVVKTNSHTRSSRSLSPSRRTASFCHGRAGHFDEFDQAISFFLPNTTWLQPPGHVHAMVHASWQPAVVNSTVGPSVGPPPSWSTHADRAFTCSGSEYRGVAAVANKTAAGCLAAAEGMGAQGVNYAVFPGNGNCYVCAVSGDPAAKLEDRPGSVSFVGDDGLTSSTPSSPV